MPTTEIVCRYPVSDGDGLFRECGGAALYQVGVLPEPACARCRDVYLACAAKAAAMLGGEDDPDAASGLLAASLLTLDRVAKALGDDATLHVERRPGGAWNAEVNYMGETIGDGGPTLAEAVAHVLADLAVERARVAGGR